LGSSGRLLTDELAIFPIPYLDSPPHQRLDAPWVESLMNHDISWVLSWFFGDLARAPLIDLKYQYVKTMPLKGTALADAYIQVETDTHIRHT
jgi:hypothetical protein